MEHDPPTERRTVVSCVYERSQGNVPTHRRRGIKGVDVSDIERIIAKVRQLNQDEQLAIEYAVDRVLVQGRASYAPWNAGMDRRDMEKEIADELADAVIYVGMRAVMRSIAKRRRIECFKYDEAIRKFDEAVAPMVEGGE